VLAQYNVFLGPDRLDLSLRYFIGCLVRPFRPRLEPGYEFGCGRVEEDTSPGHGRFWLIPSLLLVSPMKRYEGTYGAASLGEAFGADVRHVIARRVDMADVGLLRASRDKHEAV
jgi:hypothetical protein